MTLSGFLFREIIPDRHAKYVYMMAGAVVGGIVFALSQSWTWAIFYDVTTAFACFGVPRALHFLLRLIIPDC